MAVEELEASIAVQKDKARTRAMYTFFFFEYYKTIIQNTHTTDQRSVMTF